MRHGLLLSLALAACSPDSSPEGAEPASSTPAPTSSATPSTSASPGLEELLAVSDAWAVQGDPFLVASETYLDELGCPQPVWILSHPYFASPHGSGGSGLVLIHTGHAPDSVDPWSPRSLHYAVDDGGALTLAGLGWSERHDESTLPDHPPELFGVPMSGPTSSPVPGEDSWTFGLWAWPWLTSPTDPDVTPVAWHDAMVAPTWHLEIEPVHYGSLMYHDPAVREGFGYVPGACVADRGVPHERADLVGTLDPYQPDTLLTDVNGHLMAIQWTAIDDGSGAPSMFGLPFTPVGDGTHRLTFWFARFNPAGLFADTHPLHSCATPQPQCAPQ